MLGRLLRAAGLSGKRGAARAGSAFFHVGDLPLPDDAGLRDALLAACAAAGQGGESAARALSRLIRKRNPQQPLTYALLGALLERAGKDADARESYAAARRLDAGGSLALHLLNRGRHYLNLNAAAQAERCLLLAHRLQPGAAAPLEMLGFAAYVSGDTESARTWYDRALVCATPEEAGAIAINRLINTIPQIAGSAQAIDASRERFAQDLDALQGDPPVLVDPLAQVNRTAFFLTFQGRDDRELNVRLAELFLRACPALGHVAAHAAGPLAVSGRKPRVGFVSMNLGRQSVGVWYRSLVRLIIESERFDCVLFTSGPDLDGPLAAAAALRDCHVRLDGTLEQARARIGAATLDLLIHTDVGMHPFPYFLAFSRLAPVQALLVGHPDTSGIPALDYFVSNVFQDSAAAQIHYSERLVRLSRIPVLVEAIAPPASPLARHALGLADGMRYYLCPMMLQKMHPDFDSAIAAILRRDPQGELILFADRERPLWQTRLEDRFAGAMPDVADRIVFRPFARLEEFRSLLIEADCVLDPFHFSGGVTTHTALALGVPVITLGGELFRASMTAGIYAQAGIADCVATSREQYVELALGFAADRERRARVRAKIIAGHARIFDTRDAAEVFGDWIASITKTP